MKRVSVVLAAAAFCSLAQSAMAQDWRAEIYGGVALAGDSFIFVSTFDVDRGQAYGFGVYRDVGAFDLGVDVMYSSRTYTGFENDIESLSLMLAGRYGFVSQGNFNAYLGLGLGAIQVRYAGTGSDLPFSGNGMVAGAQLSLGARYDLGTGAIFSEIKYQDAFNNASIDPIDVAEPDYPMGYDSTSVVVGYSFSF